jgi:hypothetical protein
VVTEYIGVSLFGGVSAVPQAMDCGDVIGAENLLRRIAFRQHVYDGSVHRAVRAKVGFVEDDGHVDAPVGNAVVVAACGGQSV